MRNVLAVALDKIDEAAEKYRESKELFDLYEFIRLDNDLTENLIKMEMFGLIPSSEGWNYSVYTEQVAYDLGYLDKHRVGCNCIHCNPERDMPKYLKWRERMRTM